MTTAAELMTTAVVSVQEEDGVDVVGKRLLSSGHHSLPVLDADGRVTGIISERDLIDAHREVHLPTVISLLDSVIPVAGLHEYQEDLRKATAVTAGQLATPKPHTVGPDTDLDTVTDQMFARRLHALPVVDGEGKLLGIVSRSDILRALLQRS